MNPGSTFHWPLRAWPAIFTAGRYPLDDVNFSTIYRAPTHALHLYEYEGVMRFGRRAVAIAPGVVTLSPAGGDTSYDVPRRGYHLCIHFGPAHDAGPKADIATCFPAGPHAAQIAQRMQHIAQLHQHAAGKSRQAVLAATAASAALQELLLNLALWCRPSPAHPRAARSEQALERAAQLLQQKFAEPLDVPQLCRAVGLSQNYLSRLFRRRFGMTIPRYLVGLRIEHARQLLADTNMTVRQVGARVGYPDPQHFNKQFRRFEGVSPSQSRALSK